MKKMSKMAFYKITFAIALILFFAGTVLLAIMALHYDAFYVIACLGIMMIFIGSVSFNLEIINFIKKDEENLNEKK